MIDPAIGTLLSGAFALLFASAAFHKARHFAHFAAVFRAYRLVPPALPLAAFVPILELSVAAGLLLPVARPAAAVTGAALLLLYATAIGVNLLRGRHDLSCGCGGPDERRPIAAWMVVRNLLLATLARGRGAAVGHAGAAGERISSPSPAAWRSRDSYI